MKEFDISEIIDTQIKDFVKKISVSSQIVVKGINHGDYFVLRGTESDGYNFIALRDNYSKYFKEPKATIEECVRVVAIEDKKINCFDSFGELCEWYLENVKK